MEGMRNIPIYIKIRNGNFTRDPLPGDPQDRLIKYTPTKGKNAGQEIELYSFNVLSGRLVSIGVVGSEYGDNLYIEFQMKTPSGLEYRTLQLRFDSPASMDILNQWPNIDPTKEALFTASTEKTKNGNFINKIFIKQDDNWLKHAYRVGAPDGPPRWEMTTINGEEVPDKTASLNWWRGKVSLFNSNLKRVAPTAKEILIDHEDPFLG